VASAHSLQLAVTMPGGLEWLLSMAGINVTLAAAKASKESI